MPWVAFIELFNRGLPTKSEIMKRLSILFALCLMITAALFAVPADPSLRSYKQPDGSHITLRLVGDEYSSFYLSADGQPMVRNADGWFVADNNIAEQDEFIRRQSRIAKQREAAGHTAFPTIGSPHSLVILVGFKDLKFGQNLSDFDAMLNQEGYSYNDATGSCRDYYSASSYGKFSPYFDAYGPYTLSHDMAYYGGESGKDHDANPGAMVAEACQLAHDAGVDFSKYDTNGDGILDNVFVYFAGHNQAEGGSADAIWPHQGSVANRGLVLDGVRVDSYACTSEYRGYTGAIRCGVGTFCHEFGHVIGLPDFYDTNYKYYSVGNWDVMCSGSYNNQGRTPPTFTAYERFYEGWLEPTQLVDAGTYSLLPIETSNNAYLIAAEEHNLSGQIPSPSEFFLLEYRDGQGWDAGLPGHGMLVWHVDYSGSAWTSNTPNNGVGGIMRMHLEEANGIGWDKRSNGESGRSSDAYPGSQNITSFTPVLHDKTILPMPLFNISEVGGIVSFVFISSGLTNLSVDKQSFDMMTTLNDKGSVVDWQAVDVTIVGSSLAPDKDVTVRATTTTKNVSFKLYAGETCPSRNSSQWKNSLALRPEEDSTLTQKIWVSFVPSKIICDPIVANLSVKADNALANVTINASAPRVVSITAPKLKPTAQITPYSFKAVWAPVKDADQYYINLYSIEEGTSTKVQSFEEFSSIEEIEFQGWHSSTTLTTTASKGDGQRSLHMKEKGDYVQSEIYPYPVTSLSFWINAMASTTGDTIGYINLEAFNGIQWKNLDVTNITKRTKNKVIDYKFDADANYIAFRVTFYTQNGIDGSNGFAFDVFSATMDKKINYIYEGDDFHVDAWDDEDRTNATISGLEPGKTYCYQVRCSDGAEYKGGCVENLSPFSELETVTTVYVPEYLNDDKHLALAVDSINYDSRKQVVYVTAPKNGDALYIYDWVGNLVYSVSLQADLLEYPIPAERFVSGATYTIKYVEQGKLARKQRFVKAIFNR